MPTQIRKREWSPTREFLPLILGKDPKKLDKKEESKLALFEKGLANELSREDTIEQSIAKMVKMALCAEFGPSLVAAQGAKPMVATITQAIMCDTKLRKQALMIIDRLTDE